MKPTPLRVALYLRVSKRDSRQDTANQLKALREFCRCHRWEIVKVYEDRASGRWGRDRRPGLRQMLFDVRERRYDIVLVWAFDRLTREGAFPGLVYVNEIEISGARFRSMQETHLNDDDAMMRNVFISLAADMASAEVRRLSDRTKAGLVIAREKGKRLGRPVILDDKKKAAIEKMLARGRTTKEIAVVVGMSESSIYRYIRLRPKKSSKNRPINARKKRANNR